MNAKEAAEAFFHEKHLEAEYETEPCQVSATGRAIDYVFRSRLGQRKAVVHVKVPGHKCSLLIQDALRGGLTPAPGHISKSPEDRRSGRRYASLVLALGILGMVFCKLFGIRVMGHAPASGFGAFVFLSPAVFVAAVSYSLALTVSSRRRPWRPVCLVLVAGCAVVALVTCAGYLRREHEMRFWEAARAGSQEAIEVLEGNAAMPTDKTGEGDIKGESPNRSNDRARSIEAIETLPEERAAPATPPSEGERLYQKGSESYQNGKYPEAISLLEKALELEVERLGPNHPAIGAICTNLAGAYQAVGQYSEAIELYREALRIKRQQAPADAPSLAVTYGNIGTLYSVDGEYDEALAFHQEALSIWQKTKPPNREALARTYGNIASVYLHMEDSQRAKTFYIKSLELKRATLGDNDPSVALSKMNIACVYEQMGEYGRAIELHRQALKSFMQALDEDHPNIAAVNHNLGMAYAKNLEFEKAITHFEKALEINRKKLGDQHPRTQTTAKALAEINSALQAVEAP